MDISSWYSDMMSRGAFDGQLTTEQIIMKNQIEARIKKSSDTGQPYIPTKETLDNYEAIFNVEELRDETEMEEDEAVNTENGAAVDNEGESVEESGDDPLQQESRETEDNVRKDSVLNKRTKARIKKKYQNVAKITLWKDKIKKCYFNNTSAYIDIFYMYNSWIQNTTLLSRAKSPRNITYTKLKKKKSRNRKRFRCDLKSKCLLRCRFLFELKMCIPYFNWMSVGTVRDGSQLEEYFSFPEKKGFEKQNQTINNPENAEGNKIQRQEDGVSKELNNADDNQETRQMSEFVEDLIKNSSTDQAEAETKPDRSDIESASQRDTDKELNNFHRREQKRLEVTESAIEKLQELQQQQQQQQSDSREDLSVDKVTKIINEKSKEQLIKIQTLELSISKLENRLLREQLSKTNDSSSIVRLENQILRLENELIKINNSYVELRQENDQLKKGQRRYLELSHGQENNESKLSTGTAENYSAVINQHKSKLTELTYQLRNQSELVSKYKKQLEQVEDQNRMLYQIVMNQSLLISQVMKKIQVLSDQIQETSHKKSEHRGLMTPTELIRQLEYMVTLNRESRTRRKYMSSSKKRNSRQSFKYDLYETCMSKAKTCLKLDPVNNNRKIKGELPKSGSVSISEPSETPGGKASSQMNETPERDAAKEAKRSSDEIKKQNSIKSRADTRETASSESEEKIKSLENDEAKKKKRMAEEIPAEKPKDINNNDISKKKVPDDLKVAKGKERMTTPKEEPRISPERKKKTFYEDPENKDPKDCYELYQKGNTRNGAFKIRPAGFKKHIEVFCDMKNGGWTVIQRRQGGTTNFFREWNMYKKGFGGIYGEHWIGNDIIHQLTNQKECKLRVDLMDWNKNKVTAFYDYFMVEDESQGYLLHVEGFSGEGGDSLSKHNMNKFSTKDVDNDRVTKQFGGSCATRFSGAWWYHKCYSSNLNGVFYRNGAVTEKRFDGIAWKSWKGPNYSMMKTEMKIAPVDTK